MDYKYEIIDAIREYTKGDTVDYLNMLRELSLNIKNSLMHICLENEIERICKKDELCSECFEKLVVGMYREPKGEYFGTLAAENVYFRRCHSCGQIVE